MPVAPFILSLLLLLVASSNGQDFTCPGVCTEGGELLNAGEDVTVGDVTGTCGFFDSQLKDETEETVCVDTASQARDAGCLCGTPHDCPGVCTEGGEILNAGENVRVGDIEGTCGFFDNQLKDETIEARCVDTASQARDAGCVCGDSYDCPGVCTEGGELLNGGDYVKVGDIEGTCTFFDNQLKDETIEARCIDTASGARDAGCICGTPHDCPGVCAEGGELLNAGDDVKVGDVTATCGFFDNQLKNETVEQRCRETASQVRSAGCNCDGDTSAGSSLCLLSVAVVVGMLLVAI